MFVSIFSQIIPLISKVYLDRWLKLILIQPIVPINHISIRWYDQIDNVAGHDWVVSQQPVVLQCEWEPIEYLPAFIHFTGDECLFDELTDLKVTLAVQVEVEQVIVVG